MIGDTKITGSHVVVGVYTYMDDILKAIKQVKSKNLDYRVFSPCANHELEEATYPERSWVRAVTLTGAIVGVVSGFALAIMCSMDWPMRVSAKDVISPPAFVVIGYECMILFGALATFAALLHFCKLPDILRKFGYDPRFSGDKFGLAVGCSKENSAQIKSELLKTGADEVDVREAL